MKRLGRLLPRRVPPAEPLARALLDHHRDGRPRRVTALRADGVEFEIETGEYFTLAGELAELDRIALEHARGRVLDVGAGAGRHALALQAKGCEVVAIDVSPTCVLLCRERGVVDARELDVMTLASAAPEGDALGSFDTIFFGMQTIGVAGGIAPLRRLLAGLRGRLRPGGALMVKLMRVAMLLPVIVFAVFVTRSRFEGGASKPPLLPWFAVAFGLLVLLNSTGWVPRPVSQAGGDVSRWLLVASIAAIGMKTQLKELCTVGIRPVLLMLGETVFLASLALVLLRVLGH